jgi:DNA-binding transcriptional MerR regulator
MHGILSSQDVVRATGLTPRQIDYLVWQGALTPTVASGKGKGARRYYAPGDVLALRVTAHLRQAGVRTQTIEKVINFMLRHPRLQSGRELGDCCLVIDNTNVAFVAEGALATSLARRKGPMLQVIRLANFADGTVR